MELLDLPDELLDLIATHIVHFSPTCPRKTHCYGSGPLCSFCWLNVLRSLRQVCRRTSQLYSVNSNLFNRMQIVVDPEHIMSADAVIASGIVSYVEHISLVQPLYACMELEEFVELCNMPHVSKRWSGSGGMDQTDVHTDLEIADAYARYNHIAEESLVIMRDSSSLLNALVPLLKLFPRCTSFDFPCVDYSNIDATFTPRKPRRLADWALGPELDNLFKRHSYNNAALFVPKAINAIAAAGLKVRTLELSYAYNPRGAVGRWSSDRHWQYLPWDDLSKLVLNLTFLPHQLRGASFEVLTALSSDVHHLLALCARTIEHFHYEHNLLIGGMNGPPVLFEQLQHVSIACCEVQSQWFCQWLSGMPKLMSLIIGTGSDGCMALSDDNFNNWKDIFDSLRNHKTLTQGSILVVWIGFILHVRFDKADLLGEFDERHYDVYTRSVIIEYHEEKKRRFEQVVNSPTEFRRLLDEEPEHHDEHRRRRRLAKFYVCGVIDWPGFENL